MYAAGSYSYTGQPIPYTGAPLSSPELLGSFYTFCADTTAYFVPGKVYQVQSRAAAPSSFQNSLGGWLFDKYWTNGSPVVPTTSLVGYVPGHNALYANTSFGTSPNTLSNYQVAGAIQADIWTALGKPIPSGYNFEALASAANTVFGWSSSWVAAQPGTVNEISLWGPNDNYGYHNPAQAQLYVPCTITPTAVPEPASLIVWLLLGAAAVGMVLRRRRSNAA